MSIDTLSGYKAQQREMWASFAPTAIFTTPPAARLVEFAAIRSGERVLDVGTGTGVVAITAARTGADVSAVDLTPPLLQHAHENARLAGVDVSWQEGDAEELPFPDGTFDVVVSQFAHMFAPRPDVAIGEMRRVLKPGGRVAFSTWPPDQFVGRLFGVVRRHSPAPPPDVAPPPLWGDPAVVGQRLSGHFDGPVFERDVMPVPALSVAHFRMFLENSVGPIQKLVEAHAEDPDGLAKIRGEFDALIAPYYDRNIVRQEYLLTRATAR
jgi:SAM-dependent methyltransferase